jgi:AcrR family transcriptional regulator
MATEPRRYRLRARAERQSQTRDRIVRATAELHREVGPAATTVAEVARRAGVQRLTVYNHFPEPGELFAACQSHWLDEHPVPDLGPALAIHDRRMRLRAAIGAIYEWFHETAPMAEHVQRDRATLPALDALLRRTGDVRTEAAIRLLAAGLSSNPSVAKERPTSSRDLDVRVVACLRVALDVHTWRKLTNEGLSTTEAAATMADAVLGVVTTRRRSSGRSNPRRPVGS